MEDVDCSVMASGTIDVDTVHHPLVYSVFSEPSVKWRGVMSYLSAFLMIRKIIHHCRKLILFVMIEGLNIYKLHHTCCTAQVCKMSQNTPNDIFVCIYVHDTSPFN